MEVQPMQVNGIRWRRTEYGWTAYNTPFFLEYQRSSSGKRIRGRYVVRWLKAFESEAFAPFTGSLHECMNHVDNLVKQWSAP